MSKLQPLTDKAAVGLSAVCAVHCLLSPIALVMLPSLATLALDDEAFHLAMLMAVVPASLVALTMGCRRHGRVEIYFAGGAGLTVLALAAVLGHDVLGDVGEKVATLMGALVIAFSHVKNYRLCSQTHCDHDER